MSFNVSALSDFTQKATQMLQSSVLFSEDYGKYDKEVNIPYKRSVKYMSTVAPLQDYDCALTISGSSLISQKELATTWMKYEDKFCVSDYEYKGMEEIDVITELVTSINNAIAAQIDDLFWAGSGATDLFNGLEYLIDNDTNVLNQNETQFATGQTLTDSNIDNAIWAMYMNYTPAMRKQGQIVFHMNYTSFDLYKKWVMNSSEAYGLEIVTNSTNEMKVYGIPNAIIRAEEYVSDNKIHATYDKNIICLYDEVDVKSSVEIVIDPIKKENFYVLTNFKFGVDYKFGNEIVTLA